MALLLATSIVSASAFTSATVERDASVDIEQDTSGVIKLDPNTDMGGVSLTDGKLTLNLANGNGLNRDATFTFGSQTETTQAFTVTNQDSTAHDVTFKYTEVSADSDDDDANLEFQLYTESSGSWTSEGTFSEKSNLDISGMSTSTKYFVVITVDTNGLTSSDDLSGTLKITV
jgi:hypothetical protein